MEKEPSLAEPVTSGPPEPYVGLRPYKREEREIFVGRSRDANLLTDKIFSARLTLFYAQSGVGKSSVLKTLVIPQLEDEHARAIYFDEWSGEDPVGSLKKTVVKAAEELGISDAGAGAPTLAQLVRLLMTVDNRTVVLVLDQFEEILTGQRQHLDRMKKELGALIRATAVDVHVVISLRQEFLAALEPFRSEILNLFHSTDLLESLDDESVRKAIEDPAGRFGVKYEPGKAGEPGLVDVLIRDLKKEAGTQAGAGAGVDLPMLQIVCLELWRERDTKKSEITKELYDRLGGTKEILNSHVRKVMPSRWSDQCLTARLMVSLAPPSGLKISYSVDDLAAITGQDINRIRDELERLSSPGIGILRTREFRTGKRFELQHDAFIKIISPWRDKVLRTIRKWRLIRWGATAAIVVSLLSGIAAALVVQNKAIRDTRAKAERMVGDLIGEDFLAALRPVGRTTIMGKVQKRVDDYLRGRDDPRSIMDKIQKELDEYLENRIDPANPHQRNHGLAYRNKGDLLSDQGRLSEARQEYEKAFSRFNELHQRDPSNPQWKAELGRTRGRLAAALVDQGRLTEALKEYEAALTLWREIVPQDLKLLFDGLLQLTPSVESTIREWARSADGKNVLCELAVCLASMGGILADQGELQKALTKFDATINLVSPLYDDKQSDPEILKALHEGLDGKAKILQEKGEDSKSRDLFLQSRDVVKKLVENNPLAADARVADAVAVSRLTEMLYAEGGAKEALERSLQVHECFDQLKRWDPSNKKWLREWAETKAWIANANMALKTQEGLTSARKDYFSALEKMKQLVDDEPSNASWKIDLAGLRVQYAKTFDHPKDKDVALAQYREAIRLYEEVADLDARNARVRHVLGWAYLDIGDKSSEPDKVQNYHKAREIASALVREHGESLPYVLLLYNAYLKESEALREAGNKNAANQASVESGRVLQRARARYPGAVRLDFEDAYSWIIRGNDMAENREALAAYRKALGSSKKAAENDPKSPVYQNLLQINFERIATILEEEEDWGPAIDARKEALRAAEKAVELRPQNDKYRNRLFEAYRSLCKAYRKGGNPGDADKTYEIGVKHLTRLAQTAQDSENLGLLHETIGDALVPSYDLSFSKGQGPASVEEMKKALRSYEGMVEAFKKARMLDSKKKNLTEGLNRAHVKKADTLTAIASREAASLDSLIANHKALYDVETALELDKKNADYHDRLARIYARIGGTLEGEGALSAALEAYKRMAGSAKEALAAGPKAPKLDPKNADYHDRLARIYARIGGTLEGEGALSAALEAYKRMAGSAKQATELQKENKVYWNYLGLAHFRIGDVLVETKKTNEAITEFRRAVDYVDKATKLAPMESLYRENLASAYEQIAQLQRKAGDQSGALRAYGAMVAAAEAGLKIDATNTKLITKASFGYRNIGDIQSESGKYTDALGSYAQAEQEVRKAIKLKDDDAGYWNQLFLLFYDSIAPLLTKQEDQDGALKAYRDAVAAVKKAVALEPRESVYHSNLSHAHQVVGDILHDHGESEEALKSYHDAVKASENAVILEPNEAVNSLYLGYAYERIGNVLLDKGDPEKALAAYVQSEQAYRQTVKLKENNAGYWNRLFLLLYDKVAPLREKQKDQAGALKAYREALVAVEKAVALEPKNIDYQDKLIDVRGKLKSYK